MTKSIQTKLIWGIIIIALLPLLYFIQSQQKVGNEEIQMMNVKLKSKRLKQHRIFKAQFSFQEQEDNFILDNVSYKAWDKFGFNKLVKIGDSLKITIKKNKVKLLNNGKEDRIKIIAMQGFNPKKNYLSVENYNLYRSLDFVKFYIFWGVGFMIYLFVLWKNRGR